jgi:dTDP-4-amino-4,6-dideoxygalactose transaminase
MINVFGSSVGQEELDEIKSSFEAQWTGMGPKTAAFEKQYAARIGASNFALVNSCSNGLYLAMALLDLPPGSEVVLPSFTFLACGHAVLMAGCVPVYCDVDLETHNVTAETISRCLTKKTKAVMIVHYAGLPVRMDPILKLGLPIIEDAAHAADSRLGDKHCGTIGDIGVFSFDAMKNLVMGEGGGVTTRSPELAKRAAELRYSGLRKRGFEKAAEFDRWWEMDIAGVFPRLLASDVSAAMGLAQLRKLDGMQKRRKEIWDFYQKEFAKISWLVRPADVLPGDRHSYFTYCIRALGGRRDKLAKHLLNSGVYTTLRFHPLHLNPIYKSAAKLPNTETLNEEALSLPLHPRLSDADLRTIVDAVAKFPG